jgi:hypothetical protein
MVLLKSVDNVSGIDFYEYRDRAFYGKYRYRARLSLAGMRFTSFAKKPEDLHTRLAAIKNSSSVQELKSARSNTDLLCDFIKWRNKCTQDKTAMLRVEQNTAAVFSNDLSLLHELKKFSQHAMVDFTEAQTSQYSGIKHFVNEPKHKFRVYLKNKRIDTYSNFHTELNDLLERNTDLHPSPSLDVWLKDGIYTKNLYWRYHYTKASHFIDYDDESTLSYLSLMYDGILGKKYKLEKRVDPI